MLSNILPEDVVIEMLSRFPVESLMRFKCVHKSWYALIESLEFVKMQLRTKNNNSIYFPVLSKRGNLESSEGRIILSMLRYNGKVVSFAGKDLDITIVEERYPVDISCHCDGIVCFFTSNHAIIANIGIRQFRSLPESCIPLPDPYDEDDDYKFSCDRYDNDKFHRQIKAIGLGFDFKANDYKVVRVSEDLSPFLSPGETYNVEVINLGSNSWRQIENLNPRDYDIFYYWLSSYWNGNYYWPAIDLNFNVYGVLSFNFSEEEFQFKSIPKSISLPMDYGYPQYGIIDFNGALALISYFTHKERCFDIWVMDEFGFCGTWIKLLSSEPMKMDVLKPLGLQKNDQFLLILSSGQIASYSFVTNQVKILPNDDEGEITYYDGASYKSSLVSINKLYNNSS